MGFLKKRFGVCEEKRARDRKGTEMLLFKAATKLFAEKGYEATRTLEIAKEAGVNEALIGRYYGGKEGLLMAILKDGVAFQTVLDAQKCYNHLPDKDSVPSLTEGFQQYFKDHAAMAVKMEEPMRVTNSRVFVDAEVAEMIKTRAIQPGEAQMLESLRPYLKKDSCTKAELEAVCTIVTTMAHVFNFIARLIYKVDKKKIDLAQAIMSEALDDYLTKKKKKV
jgi:AcrR family transcriptional regulator